MDGVDLVTGVWSDGRIGSSLQMEIHHLLNIHPVNMVSAEYDHQIRIMELN